MLSAILPLDAVDDKPEEPVAGVALEVVVAAAAAAAAIWWRSNEMFLMLFSSMGFRRNLFKEKE